MDVSLFSLLSLSPPNRLAPSLSPQFLIVSHHFHSQPSNSPSLSLPSLSFLLPLFFLITLWFLSYTLPLILTLPLSPSHCLSLNHKGRTEPSVRLMNKVLQAQRSMFAESPSGLTHTFYSAGCSAHSNLTPHALL